MSGLKRIRVWDLPTRLFHWLLVMSIFLSWLTADVLSEMTLHGYIGLWLVGLIGFRLAWGLVGASTARFAYFVRGKEAVEDYLSGRWRGIGHNPLGGLSVVAMLLLITLTLATGLFSNDDADFSGPLAFLVNTTVSSLFTSAHELMFNVLLLLIGVHIAAIVFYKWVLGQDLIRPMIDGDIETKDDELPNMRSGNVLGLIFAVFIALGLVWLASGEWRSPPAKPAVSSPDW